MSNLTPWKKGQSGNPKGANGRNREISALARTHTKEAIDRIVDIMRNGERDADCLAAAKEVLTRGWGAPRTYVPPVESPEESDATQTLEEMESEFMAASEGDAH